MARPDTPLIAIHGELSGDQLDRLSLSTRYAEAVLRAGGLPLAIPPVGGPGDLAKLLDRVDGVLFSGGDDFHAERFGLGATHPEASPVPLAKQDWDATLARLALERGVPVLGVCYGMQLLGLIDGAGMHQHLPEDRPGARDHRGGVEHPVRIEPETKLAAAVEVEELTVVSRHHQALASASGPWRVCGRDEEGLIEAIEHVDHPFAVGVQWHPELSPEGHANDRIFRAFVCAAGVHAGRRQFGRSLAAR